MATQQETNVGGSTSIFSFSNITNFYTASEIKVKHVADDGTTTDPVSTSNVDTTTKEVTLTDPVTTGTITVYRETDLTAEDIEFQAGSSIRSVDLNKAQEVLRRGIEETREQETYQTGAEIKTAYEAQSNTNAYTDAEQTKLSGLDSSNYLAANHAASGVTSTKITNWDTAHGWGNHASAGYLTSITIADDSIAEVKLDIHNNPSNDKVLGYTSNGLEWVSQSGGGGGGIALTDISVTSASAGTAALSYDNSSGVFSYTPPDLSGYSVTSHNHDSSYSASSHNHDSSYNNYTHPTTEGNIHIPSGGSAGQFLKYSEPGTAVWDTVSSGISDIVEDTTPQLGGHLDCNSKHIKETQGAIGTASATGSISNTTGTIYTVLTSSSTPSTFTLSFSDLNFPNGTSALYLVKNAGDKTIVFSNVDWVGGYAPTISTTKYSAIEFVYVSDVSTNVIGCYLGDVD